MKTLEAWTPRRGLSIPCVTALDPAGGLLEEDQRRLVRFLIQSGRGADVIFAMGTTGEWNKVSRAVRLACMRVVVEEVRKAAPKLEQAHQNPVEAWLGVTAPTAKETLEGLEHALALGADAVVIAPLAIPEIESDPVRFLCRDVADLLDARGARIPVFLYDNPEIAVGARHLRTHMVKSMSRLDFVRGIKVSASPRRLGHYTKAARTFRDLGTFGIYVGEALSILELMRPRTGLYGRLREHWNRFLLHDLLPAGVVSGPANLWPREWQRAWQVACAGDIERMEEMKRLFAMFRESTRFPEGKRTLATLKRGLLALGVLTSDAVARGTPALSAAAAERFDAAFEELMRAARAVLPEHWRSDPSAAEAT